MRFGYQRPRFSNTDGRDPSALNARDVSSPIAGIGFYNDGWYMHVIRPLYRQAVNVYHDARYPVRPSTMEQHA